MELPEDIVTDILSRLPVKSLLRFMCVRKSWHVFMEKPEFINMHMSKNNMTYLAFMRHTEIMPSYISLICPETYMVLRNIIMPFEYSKEPTFRIVGSCRGLLCLSAFIHSLGSTCFLLNPATKKMKRLPIHNSIERFEGSETIPLFIGLGFGFDFKINDHKVVRVFLSYEDKSTGKYYSKASIYTLSSGAWRISESTLDGVVYKNHSCMAELKGALHWKAKRIMEGDQNQNLRFIVSFDLETETFRDIMLPNEFLASENEGSWQLSVLDECLSLIVNYKNGETSMHVWVMKEYGVSNSWTKIYNFTRDGGEELAGFGTTGHKFVLAFILRRRGLVRFQFNSLPVRKSEVEYGIHELEEPIEVFHYAESMINIKGKRVSPKKEDLLCFNFFLIFVIIFVYILIFVIGLCSCVLILIA
jgi:F-box interacting protein